MAKDSGWRGHLWFRANAFDIAYDPLQLRPAFGRLGFGIVDPVSLVGPAGGQLQGVVSFADGNLALEAPNVLQHHRLLVLLIFVADDIPRVGSGDLQQFVFYIIDELTSFNLRQRGFDRLFILYFIIFPLSWNTPAVESIDLGMSVEGDRGNPIVAAAGPEDLVGDADLGLDLVDRLDVDDSFFVQQHGVGLFVVSGQGCRNKGVHPLRSVAGASREHSGESTDRAQQDSETPAINCWHWRPPAAERLVVHRLSSPPERNYARLGSTSARATGCRHSERGSNANCPCCFPPASSTR